MDNGTFHVENSSLIADLSAVLIQHLEREPNATIA